MTLDPVLISAAVAPALIFLAVVSVRLENKKRLLVPRPLWTIVLAVLMGVGSAFLALGMEQLLTVKPWNISSLGTLALFTLIGVGLAEEGAKFSLMRLVLWRLDSFQERYDGILYGAAVGLGFGATENIIYVLHGGMDTAIVRGFTAVPMHGLLGIVLGYYLGKTKLSPGWGFTALWWAVVAHGFYDFLAFQNSPLASFSLFSFIVWLAWWSFKASREARRYSPSWGGIDEELLQPYTPPPIQEKSPQRAALLSLMPGFGQFYNQEPEKGKAFLKVGIFNSLLLGALGILLSYPLATLALLELGGLSLGKDSLKFVQSLQNSSLLTLLGVISALFLLYGMWDAYATAKSQKFDYLLPPDKRNRIVQNLGGSYLGHLSVVLLLVLVPILGGASGGRPSPKQLGDGQVPPMVFDIVETPQTLEGHGNSAEGTKDGKDTLNSKEQREILTAAKGEGESSKPRKSKQARHKQGIPRSYSDYLSYRLRIDPASYDFYFSQLGQDQWTVVRYRIETDGSIDSVDILEEHTTAPRQVAQIAVDDVYRMGPVIPPPTNGKAIVVTELFWRQAKIGQEGSLENRLSGLPDGRMIELES
ncbi:MAG: PrsW family glutamic-type intramembrane protease [Gloeobacterales cyanobacterium]